jgi:hypothetical protein
MLNKCCQQHSILLIMLASMGVYIVKCLTCETWHVRDRLEKDENWEEML